MAPNGMEPIWLRQSDSQLTGRTISMDGFSRTSSVRSQKRRLQQTNRRLAARNRPVPAKPPPTVDRSAELAGDVVFDALVVGVLEDGFRIAVLDELAAS